ncbi:MAG: ABC transporter ATP-binding protein, partial [Lachnospiraceae bacterium]
MRTKIGTKRGMIGRIIRTVFQYYPAMMSIVLACIVLNAVVTSIPAVFMQNIIAVVEQNWESGDWGSAGPVILRMVLLLAVLYIISLAASFAYNRMMAVVTQGSLKKLREQMFNRMQNFPVKFFDTNNHGDIMSYYTNDIDTLRQLISQSLPQMLSSMIIVVSIFCIMLYYSLWLALVVVFGVCMMVLITKRVGGASARFFVRQQIELGKVEGFVEEMMNGLKVVKTFCHEEESKNDFDRLNGQLFRVAEKANQFANTLGPILNNIGNLLYVIVAIVGGLLLLCGAPNVSVSGLPFAISIVVPFLNMTKQFSGNVNQVSQQVNAVVMAMAGAERIFNMLDEEPEEDEGYVTLVNAREVNGQLTECKERTGIWAWRHPHHDGTVTYTRLTGSVQFNDVDFEYEKGKPVLHNITLYAKPGQKIAFVGATGAGKTTITNLINRFYDIADGKIRYDEININKIRKADLRRSLGIVLQDTNLFTGTVMDNIRYGKLDATDEECIE